MHGLSVSNATFRLHIRRRSRIFAATRWIGVVFRLRFVDSLESWYESG